MSILSVDVLVQPEPDSHFKTRASYSSLTLHRKCPQAWYYRYGLKIEADEESSPYLQIGQWWTVLRAVESLERGREVGSLVFVPKKLDDREEGFDFDPHSATVADVFEASNKRWKALSREQQEDFVDKLGEPLPERLLSMYEIWDAANQERFEDEEPLGVEVYWERELPRPEGDSVWSLVGEQEEVPKTVLLGFIDEIYRDKKRGGMVVIRDHKAQKDLLRSNSALDDLMDSQLELYAWGATPLLKEHGVRPPRAVAYDRTRSVAPALPRLTASGGLSKAATNYPLAAYLEFCQTDTTPSLEARRTLLDEREAEGRPLGPEQAKKVLELKQGLFWGKLGEFYVSGARAGEPKFGIYEIDPKEVERLSTPSEVQRWTKRTLTPVNQHTVRAHLRSALDTAISIWETQVRAKAQGEAARNLTRLGCQFCDYQDLCRAQIIGGPYGEYDLASMGLRQALRKE